MIVVSIALTYAVFLLLHFEHCPIFEAPLHDVRLFVGTFHEFALGDGRPAEMNVSFILDYAMMQSALTT